MNQVGPYTSPIAYFAMLEQTQKEIVLENVAQEAAKLFKQYMEAIKESASLRSLPARDRLRVYTQRTPDIWARIASQFPHEYRDQQQDFYYLQRRIQQAKHPEAAQSLFDQKSTTPLPDAFTPNGGLGA